MYSGSRSWLTPAPGPEDADALGAQLVREVVVGGEVGGPDVGLGGHPVPDVDDADAALGVHVAGSVPARLALVRDEERAPVGGERHHVRQRAHRHLAEPAQGRRVDEDDDSGVLGGVGLLRDGDEAVAYGDAVGARGVECLDQGRLGGVGQVEDVDGPGLGVDDEETLRPRVERGDLGRALVEAAVVEPADGLQPEGRCGSPGGGGRAEGEGGEHEGHEGGRAEDRGGGPSGVEGTRRGARAGGGHARNLPWPGDAQPNPT